MSRIAQSYEGKELRMKLIKESDFRREIKSSPDKAYLFFGEEDYMKAYSVNLASETISPDPSLSFFNEIKMDSFSYSPSALLDAMMPMPMMADRKLILITGLDMGAMKQSEIDALCATLEQLEDYDYNTVIISVASDRLDPGYLPKKPSTLLKKLAEHMTLVNFEKNTPSRLAAWVGKHFEHNGVHADPSVCAFTVERCGRDMFFLASETDKASYFVKANGRDTVTRDDILNVTIAAAEYDAFALTNAIGARKRDVAIDILKDLKLRKTDPIVIMSEITRTVCEITSVITLNKDGLTQAEISSVLKLHEYKISLILKNQLSLEICHNMLARCRDADLELKNSGDGYAVIEKLICTI